MNEIVGELYQSLKSFANIPFALDSFSKQLGDINEKTKTEIEKAAFQLVLEYLGRDLKNQQQFKVESIPDGIWSPLITSIAAMRLKELKSVKVVKSKRKFNIKELRQSYYGKKILNDLKDELGGRYSLSAEEYEKVKLQCRKLKLVLPEEILPTTTERFFAGDEKNE